MTLTTHTKFPTLKSNFVLHYCAPLHEEWPKHHGHKGDPGVTTGICGAVGDMAKVILVWARVLGVGNASHPWRLRGMKVRP